MSTRDVALSQGPAFRSVYCDVENVLWLVISLLPDVHGQRDAQLCLCLPVSIPYTQITHRYSVVTLKIPIEDTKSLISLRRSPPAPRSRLYYVAEGRTAFPPQVPPAACRESGRSAISISAALSPRPISRTPPAPSRTGGGVAAAPAGAGRGGRAGGPGAFRRPRRR